jgi:hypothetical protein
MQKSTSLINSSSTKKYVRFNWNFSDEESFMDMLLERNVYSKSYDFRITYNQKCDFFICFNKFSGSTNFNNSIWFGTEPSFSKHFDPNYISKNFKYIVYHDTSKFEGYVNSNNILFEKPIWLPWYTEKNSLEIWNLDTTSKNRKCSFIVSGLKGCDENQDLYNYRLALMQAVLDSDLDIDIYGRGHGCILDQRFKGELIDKYDGLLPYQFTIAIENCREKNYVSEKFYDPINCATIPIYWGAPNVEDFMDQGAFISLNGSLDPGYLEDILKNTRYADYCEPLLNVKKKRLLEDFFWMFNNLITQEIRNNSK